MVGIPIFAEQVNNIVKLVEIGVALKMNLLELTKASLKNAILEVAENQR